MQRKSFITCRLKATVGQLKRRHIYKKNLTGPGICSHSTCIQTSMKMNAETVSQLADPVLRGEGVRTLDFPPYLQRQREKTVAEFEIRFQYFKREEKLTATIAIQGIPLKLPAKGLIRVTWLLSMTVSGMQHSYKNLPTL